MHLESTFKEQSQRLVTFDTFDQGDKKTLPDQKKAKDKDKDRAHEGKMRAHDMTKKRQ